MCAVHSMHKPRKVPQRTMFFFPLILDQTGRPAGLLNNALFVHSQLLLLLAQTGHTHFLRTTAYLGSHPRHHSRSKYEMPRTDPGLVPVWCMTPGIWACFRRDVLVGGKADLLQRGKSKHESKVSSRLGFEEAQEWTPWGMGSGEGGVSKEDFILLWVWVRIWKEGGAKLNLISWLQFSSYNPSLIFLGVCFGFERSAYFWISITQRDIV